MTKHDIHNILKQKYQKNNLKEFSKSIFSYQLDQYFYLISNGKCIWKTQNIIFPYYKHIFKHQDIVEVQFASYKNLKYILKQKL